MTHAVGLSDLVGRTIAVSDTADAHRWTLYRDLFGLPADAFCAAAHWALFTGLPPVTREDGHAAIMQPFPALPFPRRMWAGGEIEWLAPIRQGDALRRESTVTRADTKQGAAGDFLLTSLAHRIVREDTTCIEERQDIVFLPAVTRPGGAPPRAAPFAAEWEQPTSFGPVDLFRYSALTLNSHRIHYDLPYAREVEHYPDLVVHGPLLATTLIHRGLDRRPGTAPVRFTYRAMAPCFAGERLRIIGCTEGNRMELAVIGPDSGLRTTGVLDLADQA